MTKVKGRIASTKATTHTTLVSAIPTPYTRYSTWSNTIYAPKKVTVATDEEGNFELDLVAYASYKIAFEAGREVWVHIPDTQSVDLEQLIHPIPWRVGWAELTHKMEAGCVMGERRVGEVEGGVKPYVRLVAISELTDGSRQRVRDHRDLGIYSPDTVLEIKKEYVEVIRPPVGGVVSVYCDEMGDVPIDIDLWFRPEQGEEPVEDYGEYSTAVQGYPEIRVIWG